MDETKHFKLIGTTGTGKSTAIRELLGAAIARGDRAVFADPDGGYLTRFYDRYRGDVVLNPFERSSAKWDLFAEIQNSYDVEQLASGLIPASEDPSASEWRGYARTFLGAVVRRCLECDRRERCRSLAAADRGIGRRASTDRGRDAGATVSRSGQCRACSARFDRSPDRRLRRSNISRISARAPFSVREWVRTRTAGLLFIPYKAGQIAALRSMIATWMRLAIFEAMSQPEDVDQRLWIVVDELDALGAIDGLKDALARLRKFGCRCVLGFQSIAQVSSTYGRQPRQSWKTAGTR